MNGEKKQYYFRAIQINIPIQQLKAHPIEYLWGMDIWFWQIPFCKTLLLLNILVWRLFC